MWLHARTLARWGRAQFWESVIELPIIPDYMAIIEALGQIVPPDVLSEPGPILFSEPHAIALLHSHAPPTMHLCKIVQLLKMIAPAESDVRLFDDFEHLAVVRATHR